MTPKVLGLDLSLTCTGVAGNGWTDTIEPVKRGAAFRDRKDKIRDTQLRTAYQHGRLSAIRERLGDFLHGADLVVLEGIAFAAKDTDRQTAGLNWMARHWLWTWNVAYAVVPPSTLKQFVTGVGDADKELMVKFVADWFPWFDGGHDEADAAGLMAMGYAHLGMPLSPLMEHQVTALGKSAWPDQVRPVVGPGLPPLPGEPDEHGNLADSCGHCTLVPGVSRWVRGTQVGCPVHDPNAARPAVTPYLPAAATPEGIEDIALPGLEAAR